MSLFEEKMGQLITNTSIAQNSFQSTQDEDRINKTNLFAHKILEREFTIGFAGHFSAGKSSMINALTGEQLLPSSPIPTSANIVKVHKAKEDFAIVYRKELHPVKFSGDYDFDTVKNFCKDGESISQIEIGHKTSILPEGVTVMDTPGVDSTDDAHRLSTESALHLADIVFYMMDYNHVQSELNFGFTKQLLKYNENVYLIVNQIDKHRDRELSFEDFKKSVHQSFLEWGVKPKNIFFTTLKQLDHPNNDLSEVKEIVIDSMSNWKEHLAGTSDRTLQKLKDEHVSYLESEIEECKNTFADILSEAEWKSKDEILEEASRYEKQSSLLDSDVWIRSFETNRKSLLDNATLVPYELRDKLKQYLEAKQKNFKVGVLFSGKKTEEERNQRAEAVKLEYTKVIQSQIVGHIKSLMKQSLKDVGLLNDEESITIDEKEFNPSIQLIDDQVREGALLTADSVLNFANAVADATRKWFIQQTDPWKIEVAAQINELPDDHYGLADTKLSEYQEKALAIRSIEELENHLVKFNKENTKPSKETISHAEEIKNRWLNEFREKEESIQPYQATDFQEIKSDELVQTDHIESKTVESYPVEQTINRANEVASAISSIHGFQETAIFLKKKAERLGKKDFTIALFGAFSAGKSSFSNALLGENVLPVSPNPTTAAITKIRPVSNVHHHETADVYFKTADQLLLDVQLSYKKLGMDIASLEQAYKESQNLGELEGVGDESRVHLAFIKAFETGYTSLKQNLGTTLRVNRENFEQFVAQESKSCFVDTIDFYFDCDVTRLGVTLVDTPGADSINARHTGVAFEYIRNADAILFITYYNHAFARADREFLIQLGRIKDAFELDKMFFIVNAIDLAASKDEADEVKNYVAAELQKFGIRFPRLFGVSSLQALQEKQQKENLASGMSQFEQSFHHFLSDEIKSLAVLALKEETEKTVESLKNLIEKIELNLLRKEERLAELSKLEQTIRSRYAKSFASVMTKEAYQELDDLLHYVQQRVYYRFSDFFKESYNPAVFSSKSSNDALQYALTETLAMLSFDFEQEMRVTNFRLSQWIEKKLAQRQMEETRILKEYNRDFSIVPYEINKMELLEFNGPFEDSSPYQHVKSYYKNNKAFFEKNEKVKLREALEEATKVEAKSFLSNENKKLRQWIDHNIELEAEGLRQLLLQQSINQIESERLVLKESNQLTQWKTIFDKLK
ncbi:dynamin family protein [Paenisporosarcina quisquiliarum]|uniref:dynamin family protein n=1 Tax=Paenisporosarcina quisquiliarum TaxID=365346 RepID=UPI003736F129